MTLLSDFKRFFENSRLDVDDELATPQPVLAPAGEAALPAEPDAADARTASIHRLVQVTTGILILMSFYTVYISAPVLIPVTIAVLISMLVSFTLDPMLSSVWHDPDAEEHGEEAFKHAGPIRKVALRFDRDVVERERDRERRPARHDCGRPEADAPRRHVLGDGREHAATAALGALPILGALRSAGGAHPHVECRREAKGRAPVRRRAHVVRGALHHRQPIRGHPLAS